MWRTPIGERLLRGGERLAFLDGVEELARLAYDQQNYADYKTGVDIYDRLTPEQKLAALHYVLRKLCIDEDVAPATAWSEATIAAIYEELEGLIDGEFPFSDDVPFDHSSGFGVLDTIREAMRETGKWTNREERLYLRPDGTLNASKKALQMWKDGVESLLDRILWDRDFAMEGLFVDKAPEASHVLRTLSDVSEDYFASFPSDLLSREEVADEIDKLVEDLRQQTEDETAARYLLEPHSYDLELDYARDGLFLTNNAEEKLIVARLDDPQSYLSKKDKPLLSFSEPKFESDAQAAKWLIDNLAEGSFDRDWRLRAIRALLLCGRDSGCSLTDIPELEAFLPALNRRERDRKERKELDED